MRRLNRSGAEKMVAVRKAEPKDAEAAAEVLRRSITELCTLDHHGDAGTLAKWLANKTPRDFLSWLAKEDDFCVVAEANDQIMGVGLLHRSGEIRLCYLAPGAQGRGLGKAIHAALEEKARAWGLKRLHLESTVSARPFYERVGYRSVGAAKPGFGISHCHPYEKMLQPPESEPNARMLKVYGDLQSGNCYKAKLLLAQLGRPHEWVHVNILEKETRTPAFLSKNPNGKIPLLEIEEGVYLPESDAILHYLAEGTPFLPSERLLRAQVLQWLFFEQYSHEPYIAVARYIIRYLGRPEEYEPKLQEKIGPGYAALEVMERHLAGRRFFAAERYTIADIGLYAYTHVAHEGGFELSRFPAVKAWLERVKNQPGHITMSGERP